MICNEIIRSAFRRGGITGAGVPLTSPQLQIGLERLQGMFEIFSNGLLGQVCDYYLTSGDITAKEGQRIFQQDPTSVVTIPTVVVDEDTGANRAPIDGSIIMVVNPTTGVPAIWIYNMMIGAWQNIWALQLGSECPLSYQFTEALKNILAVLLCDENSMPPPPVTAKLAGMGQVAIATRRQTKSSVSCTEYF